MHSLSDAIQSVGVIIAALVMFLGNRYAAAGTASRSYYNLADPAASILFAALTLFATRRLTVDVFRILMEATPEYVDYDKLLKAIANVPGVCGVHDLHVWSLSPSDAAAAVHIFVDDYKEVRRAVAEVSGVFAAHRVMHSTVQVEDQCSSMGGGDERCGNSEVAASGAAAVGVVVPPCLPYSKTIQCYN